MRQFNIFARCGKTETERNFLVDSVDHQIARCLFMMEYPAWEIKGSRRAACFAGGEHKGMLSVWQGQGGRTAILCQGHGESEQDLAAQLRTGDPETGQ